MAKFLFLSLFLFCSFHANPQNYIITEQEIQIIENYNQKLEMERQDWLRQAKTLNQQVKELRKESMTLNQQVESLSSQLRNQREINRRLEKSYNKSEEENYQKINNLSVELDKIEKKYNKQKNKFYIALSITIVEFVLILLFIFFKIKKITLL